MDASQTLSVVRTQLSKLKESGETSVSIDGLAQFLDDLQAKSAHSLELVKLEQQRGLAHYDAEVKHSLELFRSVVEAGKEALNALLLINGGAVVALLGFMGATLSKGLPQSLGMSLSQPLLFFGLGVLSGALGFGARYLAQACYAEEWSTAGTSFNAMSISLAVCGYGLFGAGIVYAFQAFRQQFAA